MYLEKDGIIQQFNLVIYPVDFVVVIGDIEEKVNTFYKPYEEIYTDIGKPKTTGGTYRVKEKATDIPCILIWVKSIQEFTGSIITHECGHAALEIFRYIGASVNFDDQEPFCYLLGNLARLAIGSFYDIPGIKPPVVKKDAFEDKTVAKQRKQSKTKK